MELFQELEKYLACPCRYFPPAKDARAVLDAYREARERGRREGFLPMLIAAEDEILLECLEDREEPAASYRQAVLAEPVGDGEAMLSALTERQRRIAEAYGAAWASEVVGEMEGGESVGTFSGIFDFHGNTIPLALAEIPVEHPWEIFAWLPFGGWNECPDTPELMAAAKYWYEKYGAVPAVMTHDVLEFDLPSPVERKEAAALALEQYAFCPDIVDQGCETVGVLADTLSKSTKWFFWWD